MIRCDELMSIFLKNKNVVPERGASLFFLASPETAGHRLHNSSSSSRRAGAEVEFILISTVYIRTLNIRF